MVPAVRFSIRLVNEALIDSLKRHLMSEIPEIDPRVRLKSWTLGIAMVRLNFLTLRVAMSMAHRRFSILKVDMPRVRLKFSFPRAAMRRVYLKISFPRVAMRRVYLRISILRVATLGQKERVHSKRASGA